MRTSHTDGVRVLGEIILEASIVANCLKFIVRTDKANNSKTINIDREISDRSRDI